VTTTIGNTRLRSVPALAWTIALAYTAERKLDAAGFPLPVVVRPLFALVAYPVYFAKITTTWLNGTSWSDAPLTVVTVHRVGAAQLWRRWATVLLSVIVAIGILWATLPDPVQLIGWIGVTIIAFALAVAVGGGFEVLRTGELKRAYRGRNEESTTSALTRLGCSWIVADLAQRPNSIGAVGFALRTMNKIGTGGDLVGVVARDEQVRTLYIRLGFVPDPARRLLLTRVI